MPGTTGAEATRKTPVLITASVTLAGCGDDGSTSTAQRANAASENRMAQGAWWSRRRERPVPRLPIRGRGMDAPPRRLFGRRRQLTGHVPPRARYCAIRGGACAVIREPTATAARSRNLHPARPAYLRCPSILRGPMPKIAVSYATRLACGSASKMRQPSFMY
jgi:hypothetical protein